MMDLCSRIPMSDTLLKLVIGTGMMLSLVMLSIAIVVTLSTFTDIFRQKQRRKKQVITRTFERSDSDGGE